MALPKGAGALNERVTIYRLDKQLDNMGGYTETEREIGSFFAHVNVVSARDNVIADQMRELRTHEVILRLGTVDVMQGDIVAWRGSRLDVRATRPMARWLILDCVTRTV